MQEHQRSDDPEPYAHGRENDDSEIPRWLKWSFVAINRVGFPIVVFFFMWFKETVQTRTMTEGMHDMTVAINKQSLYLEELIVTINSNHADGATWRKDMVDSIRDVRNHIR